MSPLELVVAYMTSQSSYHDHKEKMAYGATTLYLTGAVVLQFHDSFWRTAACRELVIAAVVIVLLTILVLFFVVWQHRMRLEAAIVVAAFHNLSSRWIADPPGPSVPSRVGRNGRDWPVPLDDEFRVVEPVQRRALIWPTVIAYLAIAIFGALLVARAVYAVRPFPSP